MNTISLMFIDLFSSGMIAVGATAVVGIGLLLYFVFRMLKRSVKMAFRMAIVATVFIITVVGGAALWWFGSSAFEKPKAKPPASRPR